MIVCLNRKKHHDTTPVVLKKGTEISTSCFGSQLHCKPGEAYTRLIIASCEAGPGTTLMCTFDICICSSQVLEFTARYVFHNSVFGLSKCYLHIEFMKYLK
jgi:hypothetical protein